MSPEFGRQSTLFPFLFGFLPLLRLIWNGTRNELMYWWVLNSILEISPDVYIEPDQFFNINAYSPSVMCHSRS